MSGSHMVLLSEGVVYYIPPLSLTTPCELDLTNWPFDVQTCSLRFGAWFVISDKFYISSEANSNTQFTIA